MKVDSILVVASVALFAAAPVFAQGIAAVGRPERPYRGLFGSSPPGTEPVLTVSGSVGSGYDTNPRVGQQGSLSTDLLTTDGSFHTMLEGGLSFDKRTEKIGFGAAVDSALRHYPQINGTRESSYGASVGGAFAVSDGTRLIGNQMVTYQSVRGFLPFLPIGEQEPGDVSAPDLNFAAQRRNYTSYGTTAGLSHRLTRETSLGANYSLTTSDYAGSATSFRTQTAQVRVTRSLTRGLGLRLGYGLTDTRYTDDGGDSRNHNIDAGLDFSHALSLTRRTQLAFSTGATALKETGGTRYDVIGAATLTHEMGRSWTAALVYNRNVGYNDAIRGPYFYDGFNANLGGLISRKVSVDASAGFTLGRVTTSEEAVNDDFQTWYGQSGIRFALTRHLALGAEYVFYKYDFDEALLLSDGFLPVMTRHSIQFSLDIWAALVESRRRPDATR